MKMIAIVAERPKNVYLGCAKLGVVQLELTEWRGNFFLTICFFFLSQSELSFLRNQLEESKLQQQELTDSIDEKVRCW